MGDWLQAGLPVAHDAAWQLQHSPSPYPALCYPSSTHLYSPLLCEHHDRHLSLMLHGSCSTAVLTKNKQEATSDV